MDLAHQPPGLMLGEAIARALPELQAHAESRMRETCTIDRVTGVTSDDDGRPVAQTQPIYEGPVRIRSYRPYPQDREVAGGTSTSQMYDLHIPAPGRIPALVESGAVALWAGYVRNGDYMTRTTPGRAPEVYRIETEHDVTDQTAQRLVGSLQTGGIQP